MKFVRLSVFILANVLTLCFVSNDLLAQRPGGGGGRGFGGGFGGGPGGMMMGGRGGVMDLLRLEEVQKELKLTDDQKKAVTDEGTKMGEVMREMFSGFTRGQAPTDADRKKMEENQKKLADMGKAFEKQLETTLDPDQQDRLVGLMLQRSGARALTTSDMVAAALAVTDDQKTKFAEAEKQNAEEMQKAMAEFRPAGGGGGGQDLTDEERTARRETMQKKMEELNKSAEDRLLAVLTDDQKTKMESLKGAKFEFPAPQFGFPGGPGGGRGGRGGRPGGGGN